MARHAHHRAKALPAHARRRLSEEGKRLLRHALSHDGDDLSVVSNKGDGAADSDLEGFVEWQQPAPGDKKARKRLATKLRDQYDDDQHDGEAHDALDAALEQLGEKREASKVEALRAVLAVLATHGTHRDRVRATALETLTSQALATLKKRAKESGALALRVLAVVAITLGPDEQKYFDAVRGPLRRVLTDDHASTEPTLRVEAAYALSVASYVCCREDDQRWDALDALGGLLVAAKDADDNGDVEDEFSEALLVALIECWAFLVSGFHPSIVVPKIRDEDGALFEHVEALAGFVREGMNPAIRSAACEALALLVQDKYIVGKGMWSYAMEETTSPLGGLESKIARYMHETAKNIGKKNRKLQRSMLKEVLQTLQTGEGPHQELEVGDETLALSTWSRFFQANVFRHALQSGFQVHLHENAVLRDVFDISENTNAKISMVSTVRRRSDLRSKTLNKRTGASRKAAEQNAFLYDD